MILADRPEQVTKKKLILQELILVNLQRQEFHAELDGTNSRRNSGNNKKEQDRPFKQSAGMRVIQNSFTSIPASKEKRQIKRIHVIEID